MNLRNKFFILITLGIFLTGQWGCATGRYGYPKPEPLPEEYRAQLGTIGVVSVPGVPDIHFDRPLPTSPGVLVRMGEGAWEGGKKSGEWMVDLCSLDSGYVEKRYMGLGILAIGVMALWGACFVLSAPVAILGGIGGFFYGVVPSSSAYPPYVEETEGIIRDTLAKYPIQENFQGAFVKVAHFRTAHTLVVGSEEGSQPSEGMVGQGVDTILELSVQRIWLKRAEDREGDMNPLMVLSLVAQVRLIQATEKTLWYDHTFVHETKKRSYTYWRGQVFNPYSGFQTDIEQTFRPLAEQMVNELFFKTSN